MAGTEQGHSGNFKTSYEADKMSVKCLVGMGVRALIIEYSEVCSHCANAHHLEFRKHGEDFITHIFDCKLGIDAVVHGFANEVAHLELEQFLQSCYCDPSEADSISRKLIPFWFCPLYCYKRG